MSVHQAKRRHEIAYQEVAALLKRHAETHNLSGAEMLAVFGNMLGKVIAFQDQRTMSPSVAMEIVARNIEIGNQQAIDQMMQPGGRA